MRKAPPPPPPPAYKKASKLTPPPAIKLNPPVVTEFTNSADHGHELVDQTPKQTASFDNRLQTSQSSDHQTEISNNINHPIDTSADSARQDVFLQDDLAFEDSPQTPLQVNPIQSNERQIETDSRSEKTIITPPIAPVPPKANAIAPKEIRPMAPLPLKKLNQLPPILGVSRPMPPTVAKAPQDNLQDLSHKQNSQVVASFQEIPNIFPSQPQQSVKLSVEQDQKMEPRQVVRQSEGARNRHQKAGMDDLEEKLRLLSEATKELHEDMLQEDPNEQIVPIGNILSPRTLGIDTQERNEVKSSNQPDIHGFSTQNVTDDMTLHNQSNIPENSNQLQEAQIIANQIRQEATIKAVPSTPIANIPQVPKSVVTPSSSSFATVVIKSPSQTDPSPISSRPIVPGPPLPSALKQPQRPRPPPPVKSGPIVKISLNCQDQTAKTSEKTTIKSDKTESDIRQQTEEQTELIKQNTDNKSQRGTVSALSIKTDQSIAEGLSINQPNDSVSLVSTLALDESTANICSDTQDALKLLYSHFKGAEHSYVSHQDELANSMRKWNQRETQIMGRIEGLVKALNQVQKNIQVVMKQSFSSVQSQQGSKVHISKPQASHSEDKVNNQSLPVLQRPVLQQPVLQQSVQPVAIKTLRIPPPPPPFLKPMKK